MARAFAYNSPSVAGAVRSPRGRAQVPAIETVGASTRHEEES
jgi:hypothetical protein